jgi:hypothetical protein
MKASACAPAFTSFEEAWNMDQLDGRDGITGRSEKRWFEVLNIEPQNKKPQNEEVITSIFCGSERS